MDVAREEAFFAFFGGGAERRGQRTLSNCARTFIAIDGVSSPLVTISSKASVNVIPRVDLRYSS